MDFTYIVIKIGDKVFSTLRQKPKRGSKGKVRVGRRDDKYAREDEESLWCKGEFIEGRGHREFKKKPLPFELNIYSKKEKQECYIKQAKRFFW